MGDRPVMSQVTGQVTGWVMEYDEWVTRGEELGDEVRGAGTQRTACWVWRMCGRVLSNRNIWFQWLQSFLQVLHGFCTDIVQHEC